jgi:hypothetical protein
MPLLTFTLLSKACRAGESAQQKIRTQHKHDQRILHHRGLDVQRNTPYLRASPIWP